MMAHPAWDEWIEINWQPGIHQKAQWLIPLGMSGLKFLLLILVHIVYVGSSRLG